MLVVRLLAFGTMDHGHRTALINAAPLSSFLSVLIVTPAISFDYIRKRQEHGDNVRHYVVIPGG
jgi:hypothetical protein